MAALANASGNALRRRRKPPRLSVPSVLHGHTYRAITTGSWHAGRSRNMRTGEPPASRDATGTDVAMVAATTKRGQLQSAIYSSRSEKGAQVQPIDGAHIDNSLETFTPLGALALLNSGRGGVATAQGVVTFRDVGVVSKSPLGVTRLLVRCTGSCSTFGPSSSSLHMHTPTNTVTLDHKVAPPSLLWSHGHSHGKIEIAHNLLSMSRKLQHNFRMAIHSP